MESGDYVIHLVLEIVRAWKRQTDVKEGAWVSPTSEDGSPGA